MYVPCAWFKVHRIHQIKIHHQTFIIWHVPRTVRHTIESDSFGITWTPLCSSRNRIPRKKSGPGCRTAICLMLNPKSIMPPSTGNPVIGSNWYRRPLPVCYIRIIHHCNIWFVCIFFKQNYLIPSHNRTPCWLWKMFRCSLHHNFHGFILVESIEIW